MRVVHLNSSDLGGGAERIASDLCRATREAGHLAWLVVGRQLGDDPNVVRIPDRDAGGPWRRFWRRHEETLERHGARLAARLSRGIADPIRLIERALGREDFRYPGSRHVRDLVGAPPDVIHLHNLHGGYFDLRVLGRLSRQQPTFVTLHDPWLLTGHCAHPFECGRWKLGCGGCPDLEIYPAVRRDATAFNWRRKSSIYRGSRLFVASPSRWLGEMVEHSMLWPAIEQARVIPNGVDLRIFRPGDRSRARAETGIAPDALVALFASNGLRRSRFRDYRTLRAAIDRLPAEIGGRPVSFVALGDEDADGDSPNADLRFVPYQRDPEAVARFYRAADLLVHATLADTFPNVVLEAGGCGTPVVATAIGGIPEQIEAGRTGELVAAGDAGALAAAIESLFRDASRRRAMGDAASRRIHENHGARRMADDYLSWYEEVLSRDSQPARRRPS
jgi:glycosyltransferase involved in cell wall biosynthesis